MNKLASYKEKLFTSVNPVLSILIAFIMAGLVVTISGGKPIDAYRAIAKGAFGSSSGIRNTFRYTFPLLLLAMSFALCNKCGYFNIGQEGQMYASVIAICWVQKLCGNLPQPILMVLIIFAAMLAGAIMCLLPALLKVILKVNEVIIAILLNNLLVSFLTYSVLYTGIASPKSSKPKSLTIVPEIPLTAVLIATLVILIVYALVLKNTVPGFRLRMIGMNSNFASSSGIHTIKTMLIVSALGGALAGLAASGEVLSIYHETYSAYADGMGFTSMTAALIGKGNAVGMMLGSLLLGALSSGAVNLSIATDTPSEMILVIKGFVMLFATINILQYFRISKHKEKRARTPEGLSEIAEEESK